jgi:hypothetical protein
VKQRFDVGITFSVQLLPLFSLIESPETATETALAIVKNGVPVEVPLLVSLPELLT